MSLSGDLEGRSSSPRLTLGERIRMERQRLRMTQSELAGREMTKSFISQVEANVTRPSLRSLQLLARRLNRPVSYFLDEPEGQPRSEEISGLHLIREARNLAAQGAISEALATLSRALEEAPPLARVYRARILSLQAELFTAAGRPQEAAERYASAAEEWHGAGDEREESLLLLAWARFERDRGSAWERVARILERAEHRLSGSEVDPWLHATVRAELGLAYARMGAEDDAVEHLRAALHGMDDLTDFARYGEVALTLGHLLDRAGQLDAARLMVERALYFFQALGDRRWLVEGYLRLARVLARAGDLPGAARMVDEAARLAQEAPTGSHLSATVLRARAWVEARSGDARSAEAHWNQALSQAADALTQAHVHRELARFLLASERPEEARTHLERGLELLEGSGDPAAPLGPFRQELAKLYQAAGEDQGAARLLAAALDWFQAKGGSAAWTRTQQDLWLLEPPIA